MSEFIIGALLLVAIALILAAVPWIKRTKRSKQDELTNTRLVKHRLTELVIEQQQGLLTAQDRQQAEAELKLALLDELDTPGTASKHVPWILMLGLIVGLSVSSWVYFKVNQLTQLSDWQTTLNQLPELGKRINSNQDISNKELQDFALGLRTKLHEEPDNPVGWMLLGRVWGALNQPQTAKDAFEKSLNLNPDSVGALLSYAQSLILIGGEGEVSQSQRILQRVLQLDPQNVSALGTLAIVATESGENELALKSWQALLALLPPDNPNYAVVEQKVGELEAAMGAKPETRSTSSTLVASTQVDITVQITEALRAKLPASGVLFVFAQDPSGKIKMPAAVVKLPVSPLPVTVSLSDKNAMIPSFTLSGLQQAKLVARVSADENVTQAKGELQGEITIELNGGAVTTASILINEEIL